MPCTTLKGRAAEPSPLGLPKEGFEIDDEYESNLPSCRICFEESKDCSQFISPCKCIGTQQYVHFRCLRRWQTNVIAMNDATDVRAYRCGVCCTTYSSPPPKPTPGLRLVNALRGVGGAVCISLLAFGLSGPPWPHLALLVLVLLGTRSTSLLALALLLVGSLVASLHTRGLRVVMRVDGQGRMGLALIRHGAPIEGLREGSLLVAAESLDRGVFRRSVVLLTEHSAAGGTRGVILTQPLPYADTVDMDQVGVGAAAAAARPPTTVARGWTTTARAAAAAARAAAAAAANHAEAVIKHQLGGPVGMPSGPGSPASEMAVLHTVPGVGGATRLLPLPPWEEGTGEEGGAGGAATGGASYYLSALGGAGAPSLDLYYGGALAEVAQRVMSGGSAAAAAGGVRRAGGAGGAAAGHRLWVYHGVCAWAPGQLEGEVRGGSWGFADARLDDLTGAPPEHLWWRLAHDPHRLRWGA